MTSVATKPVAPATMSFMSAYCGLYLGGVEGDHETQAFHKSTMAGSEEITESNVVYTVMCVLWAGSGKGRMCGKTW